MSEAQNAQERAQPLLERISGSRWLQPFNNFEAIDELLEPLGTTFALHRGMGRITAIRDEAPGVKTFELRTNRNWKGFEAGQHTLIKAEINGRLVKRAFSLTSDPADARSVAFTIKRNPAGTLSKFLHDTVKPGDILRLGLPARGSFVLPSPRPSRILMIGAGSGVTPFRSMLRTLHREGYAGRIDLMQICRDRGDAIFGAEFERLAAEWPAFTWSPWYTTQQGRPGAAALMGALDALDAETTLLCGPQELMLLARSAWAERGRVHTLLTERYGIPLRPVGESGAPVQVHLMASGRVLTCDSGEALLPQLERAGLAPQFGCRAGLCHTCRYRKTSGQVSNLLNGETSAEPDELIQLCVCAPRSDLELADL